MRLAVATLRTSVLGIAALAILIGLPAWSLNYWQGWVFIAVFAIATNLIGVYLALKDPVLLERRKRFGPGAESRGVQKMIAWLAIFGSAAMLVVCALDYRFGWSRVPPLISLLGDMLVVLGLLVDWFVLRENSFGSSTIEAVEGQKVISTGPYALVRHPMYVGVLIMLIGVPPAPGSWWGLLFLLLFVPALVWRILDEEELLKRDLTGYADYLRTVRYRLVPGFW
ncbi:MAG: isoprenylcysteine carboxylmethyltransferase family protein [Planctomycetaceae bacterium]|nr:isoprenylcysteine carboxylmethyltransferase family protein [Planctomycetaceae bacterium]